MTVDRESPARKRLDRALTRFVDEALAGDDDAARVAFVDCQALMPARPAALLADGREWVAAEQALMAQVASNASDRAAQATLASLRGRGGRR